MEPQPFSARVQARKHVSLQTKAEKNSKRELIPEPADRHVVGVRQCFHHALREKPGPAGIGLKDEVDLSSASRRKFPDKFHQDSNGTLFRLFLSDRVAMPANRCI